MRNWIIGAAAMLAVAVPGVAAAGTGYIDLGYTSSNVESGGLDADADTWAAGGAYAFDANTLGVQLDARIGSADADGGDDVDFWGIGGHVYSRSDRGLIGGYVGIGNIDDGSDDVDEWTVAVEGQYYMAQTTLNGALSYSDADDADLTATALDLGVRHFINDNFSVGADVGFANIDAGLGGDVDSTSYGINAEYQLATVPVSVFGGWAHTNVDDLDLDTDSFTIGVRYNWGGTLFDRDRHGASLARRAGGFSRVIGGIV